MAEEHLSPIQRLEILEAEAAGMKLAHIALEAQVLILDQIMGCMLITGHPPTPEQMKQFRAMAAKQIQAKYPGVQLRQEEPKPTLYVSRMIPP